MQYSRDIRDFLDGAWIGRGSLFFRPSRSPDLTVLEFCLCGIKELVFATRQTTRDSMFEIIRISIQSRGTWGKVAPRGKVILYDISNMVTTSIGVFAYIIPLTYVQLT